MMSKLYISVILTVFLASCFAKNGNEPAVAVADESNRAMFVNAPAGLRVRNSPSVHGDVIGALSDLSEVVAVRENDHSETINGIEGRWTFVETDDIQGWVFGGFLSLEPVRRFEITLAETPTGVYPTHVEVAGRTHHLVFSDGSRESIIDGKPLTWNGDWSNIRVFSTTNNDYPQPDYAHGNGTIINTDNTGNATRILRRHIQRIQLYDDIPISFGGHESIQIYLYPEVNENLIIGELVPWDFINIEDLLEISAGNNYFVWLYIRKDDGINGWILSGEYEYERTRWNAPFIGYSAPYINNRWEILDHISINNRSWTIRRLEQYVSVWRKTEIRDNPGLVDTKIISNIIIPETDNPVVHLEVIAATEECDTINGIDDRWLKINHDGTIGWIFGGPVSVERGGPKYLLPDTRVLSQLVGP